MSQSQPSALVAEPTTTVTETVQKSPPTEVVAQVEPDKLKKAEVFGATSAPEVGETPTLADLHQHVLKPSSCRRKPGTLTFSPYAWAKLEFMRDIGKTEISGFGICEEPDNLLHVTDFQLVKQCCNEVLTTMDDDGLVDFNLAMAQRGLHPQQYGRIWIHTHPNMSPNPSGQDEATFRESFGSCNWAVMFILATTGKFYGRIRFTDGPSWSQELPVEIDWRGDFPPTNREAWLAEYLALVTWDRGIAGRTQGKFFRPWEWSDSHRTRYDEEWEQERKFLATEEDRQAAAQARQAAPAGTTTQESGEVFGGKAATQIASPNDPGFDEMDAHALLEEYDVDLSDVQDLPALLHALCLHANDEWLELINKVFGVYELGDAIYDSLHDTWLTVEEAIIMYWTVDEIIEGYSLGLELEAAAADEEAEIARQLDDRSERELQDVQEDRDFAAWAAEQQAIRGSDDEPTGWAPPSQASRLRPLV